MKKVYNLLFLIQYQNDVKKPLEPDNKNSLDEEDESSLTSSYPFFSITSQKHQ